MKFDSYPVFLDENEFVEFWRDYYKEHQWTDTEDLALYVHYPWCRSVCKFCVFGALKYDPNRKDLIAAYEKATLRMIEKMDPVLSMRLPTELFFGGGTPSLWTMESLAQIPKLISIYDKIPIRRSEVHPYDLTPERIQFMVEVMKFDHVSMGVQSFDHESNVGQNRIPVDKEKLAKDIREFQKNGLYVNMDLVALFNGDDPKNWKVFEEDLIITAELIKPDGISVSPNYKSEDYYGNSREFRKIIKRFSERYPQYHVNKGEMAYSQEWIDILKYMDSPYIFLTDEYAKFVNQFPVLKENKTPEELTNRNVIGFGGVDRETAFSRTSELDYLMSRFNFQEGEFRYSLEKKAMFKHLETATEEEMYNTSFYVGNYILPPPKRLEEN